MKPRSKTNSTFRRINLEMKKKDISRVCTLYFYTSLTSKLKCHYSLFHPIKESWHWRWEKPYYLLYSYDIDYREITIQTNRV
jgi:hypothetical protein